MSLFKVTTKRTVTVKSELKSGDLVFPVSYTVTKSTVEDGTEHLRDIVDPANPTESEQERMFYGRLRRGLTGWTGFADEDGNELPSHDENGKIIAEHQIAVFEQLADDVEAFKAVLKGFNNLSVKN